MAHQPHKRSVEADIEIDGHSLHWEIKREPQFPTPDGYGGLTFSVQSNEGKYRELILEYPFPDTNPALLRNLPDRPERKVIAKPERPKIVPEHIEADIRLAMEAGWDPFSRGRPFLFQVPMEIALQPKRKV